MKGKFKLMNKASPSGERCKNCEHIRPQYTCCTGMLQVIVQNPFKTLTFNVLIDKVRMYDEEISNDER